MTIKALNGGKLLCLMAVAGAMTLGSCSKDDDDKEPEPAPVVPVDTTKKLAADEFYFRLSNSQPIALNTGDTIKANTLLNNGVNSDTISVDVILRNGVMVNPNAVSFSFTNSNLGKVNIANPSITDSIYSVSFPAVEGSYILSINNNVKSFLVAGTGKTTSANRSLSNKYTVKLDSVNTTVSGIEYVGFTKTELTSTVAHLKGNGKFIVLSDEDYAKYLTSALSFVKGDVEDKLAEAKSLLPLNEVKHFVYVENSNIVVVNIVNFAGAEVANAPLTVEITY